MTTIGLVANDQLLQVMVNPNISSGEVNTIKVHVDFSDEWDNFGKNAVFYTSYNSRDIYEMVMTNDECIVPSEVMKKSGTLYIGIRGVNSEKNEVKTTSLVKLKISEGAPTGNSTEVEPTPGVYQQLLTAYGKTDNSINKEISDRKSAIATEKAERQTEIAVERNRITNLATLPGGSTTGDAELIDARVGYDGFTYPSAGDSVRNQTGEINYILNNELNTINLFNEATISKNTVISSTGEVVSNTQYITSDFIRISKGSYWFTRNEECYPHYFGLFNKEDKSFWKRIDVSNLPGNVMTAESDCYIRVMFAKAKLKSFMIVRGTEEPIKYLPYGVNLDGKKILNNTIRKEKTDFIKSSSNLINHNTIKKGYSINANGVIVENTSYSITDKIYLKPSTNYTFVNVQRICYFDEDDNFISMNEPVKYLPTNVTTIKTPIGISYAIILIKNTLGKYQLNEGDKLLEYEKHYILIDGYKISDGEDEVEDTTDSITKIQNWDKTVFDKAPLFTLENDLPGYSANNGDITVTRVLEKYNELATANPDYITKTELGADISGNMLYRFDFVEPEQKHTNTGYSQNKPKVILISGVHPEYGGIWCLYNAMNEITNNPELIDLRRNVHFIVVPIVNYYGCLNYNRKNANGVDLARNFEIGFVASTDTSSNTYGGATPLSELECQYIDTLLSQNTDAVCFASCHSFQSGGESGNDAMWGASATLYETNLTMKVIDKLSRVWKTKYDCIPSDVRYLGTTSLDAPNGSESKQAMKYGIQGLTLEIGDYFKYQSETDRWSSMAISRGTEVYINWLLVNLYNYENGDKNLI